MISKDSTKFKEAIKTALAMVLVYWIALRSGWMDPYWAGFAVAMVSVAGGKAGQSIRKGFLRLAGTIPGCIAALIILSLAPQNRWFFILLISAWLFFTTYMMIADKEKSYMWNVAGFVCLVITLTGPGSSEGLFETAIFRTVETAMGVVVYTLVTVFLWPRTNAGAIKKAGVQLVTTQAALFHASQDVMLGRGAADKLQTLHSQMIQQDAELKEALQAEGSESYEVYELRHYWERYKALSAELMETLDRWQAGLNDLARIEIVAVVPDLPVTFTDLNSRFEAIQRLLVGKSSDYRLRSISLPVDGHIAHKLSPLDKAIVGVSKKEFKNLERLTRSMLECARSIAGEFTETKGSQPIPSIDAKGQTMRFPVPDLDHMMGATYAAISTFLCFLVWIYLDPPGHDGWYQLGGTLAMAIAVTQQLKATLIITPLAVASALAIAVYVLIMPRLSTFVGLGTLLFLSVFVVTYFFSGFATLVGLIAVLSFIAVQNQQVYNFAAMANSFIYMPMAIAFVFGLSYMLRSARPEKAVLHLLGRYFRSAEFLVAQMAPEPGRTHSFIQQWKAAYHRYEMQTLPAKIGAWGKAIDRRKFPNNTPDQVQKLVASLHTLFLRVDEFLDANDEGQAHPLAQDLHDDLKAWRQGLERAFAGWSDRPEMRQEADRKQNISAWLTGFEMRVENAVAQIDPGDVVERNAESFYRLLGGYRGTSQAALAFAEVAGQIDWSQWREERF